MCAMAQIFGITPQRVIQSTKPMSYELPRLPTQAKRIQLVLRQIYDGDTPLGKRAREIAPRGAQLNKSKLARLVGVNRTTLDRWAAGTVDLEEPAEKQGKLHSVDAFKAIERLLSIKPGYISESDATTDVAPSVALATKAQKAELAWDLIRLIEHLRSGKPLTGEARDEVHKVVAKVVGSEPDRSNVD